MSLNFSHKPNYFLNAQLLIRHLENLIKKNNTSTQITLELSAVFKIFQEDFASTTTNLDGILNIADEYKVDTLHGDAKLIENYQIKADENQLSIQLNEHAVQGIREGKKVIEPDANDYR